ncbi:hypothetical protein DFR29_10973 [Tahibacter aquaticus]|uniref:Uncharacterized protein n=1 Tax=Tahibacter aquaticus TaxID=520092 RepID=A0A4R6YUL1_9GAMM|nr:hypothetical protein DFR29_10973 [Tahibacter aquaticus]
MRPGKEWISILLQHVAVWPQAHVIAATAGRIRTAILDLAGIQPAVLIGHGDPMALADGLLLVASPDGTYVYDVVESLFADSFESH